MRNTQTNPSSAPAQRVDPKNAKANADGSIKIHAYGQGLELWVSGSGLKTWRTKAQRDGKRIRITLGTFPEINLTQARSARQKIRDAENPERERRVEKAQAKAEGTTLREVAAAAIGARSIKANWTDGVLDGVNARVESYILPKLGDHAIADVAIDDVEKLIVGLHQQKHPKTGRPIKQTAVFVKQHLSMIFDYALAKRMITFNPVRQIAPFLPSHTRGDEKPRPYVKTIEEAQAVLRAVEARAPFMSPWTLLALRLVALTAVRSSEALGARFSEFDLDRAVWTIPAERMKGKYGQKREHYVALSPQAIEVVKVALALRKNEFVFPSHHKGRGCMDRSTLSLAVAKALDKAGIGRVLVPHGWRSTFMTIGNEVDDGANFRVRDVMLAHSAFRDHAEEKDARKGGAERHYNHATYMSARHRIACQWADMLLPPGSPTALGVLTRIETTGKRESIGSMGAIKARDALRAIEAPASNVVPLRRTAA